MRVTFYCIIMLTVTLKYSWLRWQRRYVSLIGNNNDNEAIIMKLVIIRAIIVIRNKDKKKRKKIR